MRRDFAGLCPPPHQHQKRPAARIAGGPGHGSPITTGPWAYRCPSIVHTPAPELGSLKGGSTTLLATRAHCRKQPTSLGATGARTRNQGPTRSGPTQCGHRVCPTYRRRRWIGDAESHGCVLRVSQHCGSKSSEPPGVGLRAARWTAATTLVCDKAQDGKSAPLSVRPIPRQGARRELHGSGLRS